MILLSHSWSGFSGWWNCATFPMRIFNICATFVFTKLTEVVGSVSHNLAEWCSLVFFNFSYSVVKLSFIVCKGWRTNCFVWHFSVGLNRNLHHSVALFSSASGQLKWSIVVKYQEHNKVTTGTFCFDEIQIIKVTAPTHKSFDGPSSRTMTKTNISEVWNTWKKLTHKKENKVWRTNLFYPELPFNVQRVCCESSEFPSQARPRGNITNLVESLNDGLDLTRHLHFILQIICGLKTEKKESLEKISRSDSGSSCKSTSSIQICAKINESRQSTEHSFQRKNVATLGILPGYFHTIQAAFGEINKFSLGKITPAIINVANCGKALLHLATFFICRRKSLDH